jgi:arylsulfatase
MAAGACGPEPVSQRTRGAESTDRPNILLIVADDMGYSDAGAYGSEIATPSIDALASEGVLLAQYHVAPNCGPTRGALLTGVDSHRAGLGGNPEVIADNQQGSPAYQGYLRDDVVTMAELLRDAGYHTFMTGKWHLGHDARNLPGGRGFEQSFALLNGGASHWADQAPLIPGATTHYVANDQPADSLPADFYSTTVYTDLMIEFIESNAGDGAPFFGYLSFTAPHNPLHVPAGYADKYRGRYDRGWDVVAEERAAGLREHGLLAGSHVPHPRPDWVLAWDSLSPDQQAQRARDMEIYAGMIDYMDESIGRVLDYLREIGEFDNTLIVFMSDNGPSKTAIQDYLSLGGPVAEFVEQFDNSLDNKGQPGSSTDIGPGWAFAAASPLRLFKGYVAQGGIQVPAIVKLPGETSNAGTIEATFTHVTDLMPTFLEVAGAFYPETYDGQTLPPLQGTSLLPLLEGTSGADLGERGVGWSAYGMDAFRRGDWKVLRLPEPFGTGEWQLYNLSLDPGEVDDLAAEHPEVVAELARAWEGYARDNGVIKPSEPVAYGRTVSAGKF